MKQVTRLHIWVSPVVVWIAFLVIALGVVLLLNSLESDFEAADDFIQECLKSEQYTTDECIAILEASE